MDQNERQATSNVVSKATSLELLTNIPRAKVIKCENKIYNKCIMLEKSVSETFYLLLNFKFTYTFLFYVASFLI